MQTVRPLACLAILTLAACGGAPASNELRLDNDGNGRFSGNAGFGWTASEIQAHVQGQCGGPVTGFSVRTLEGGQVFSGQCASGALQVAPVTGAVPMPANAQVAPVPIGTIAPATGQPSPFPTGIPIPANSMDHR